MEYRRLGKAGIKVSELSFGSWLTFGPRLDVESARACMRRAFEAGINFFDNAEAYADGKSEEIMGEVLKEYRREDLVISTKIFWGGEGPNDKGLSWKHLMEGTHNALKRMQLDYVDLLYCHRPDPDVPMEEVVRCMDNLVRSGKAFYWGTSEWSSREIEEAHRVAREYNCLPPCMEQPQYNLFNREKVEEEFAPLYDRYGMGTTIWSPLFSGILTGKYQQGIPEGTRLDRVSWLKDRFTDEVKASVNKLAEVAKSLDMSLAQMSIAWCMKNPNVSTVILGASSLPQLEENLGALEAKTKLDAAAMKRIEACLPE